MADSKRGHDLKAQQGRKDELLAELKVVSGQRSQIDNRERNLKAELERVQKKLDQIQGARSEPTVSEHAMLRYLERVKGINLKDVANEILTPDRVSLIKAVRSCEINVNGMKLIVCDGVVVTARER